MKVKLFYSYSHKDECHRNELEKHLATLRDKNLLDEWHDRKINAGENWNEEIEKNMGNADIILLLFSPDFIASESCKKEIGEALRLKQQKNTIFIPIILRECAWKDIDGMSEILALPKDGSPIQKWHDKDSAWTSVYEGIKNQVEKIKEQITPELKDEFRDELLKNPTTGCTLDKLFVYPDILEINKSEQRLENNEVDSKKLTDIKSFKHKYILVEGDEQSGKSSLCNMLYLSYVNTDFYPILINGKSIAGKIDIKSTINKVYGNQYNSTQGYWSLDKKKRILLIDNINERIANNDNYANFLQSIKDHFEYAIIFIDQVSNLSDKSTEHNYFYLFDDYAIKSLGHKKRNELIKKCIENDENTQFSMNSNDQVARLDKDTKHINTIIGSNIFPSYPVFIISTFNIVETVAPQDMHQTSYGHCYHAMITTQLYRINIKAGDMDQYFNFLTEISYFMFNKSRKHIYDDELSSFLIEYKTKYIVDENVIENLIDANILSKKDTYSFQYLYIYYYFVAKYIADNIEKADVKNQIDDLILDIHKKDNSNIVVFITHHSTNKNLLDDILFNTMLAFENFSEATLEKEETKLINEIVNRLKPATIAPDNHNVEEFRDENLEAQDRVEPAIQQQENEIENTDDCLLIEIRKSAKNIEIIGQIMRNQYGTFEKNRLNQLFEEGQNVGLRLLKSFIDLIDDNSDGLENFIQEKLLQISKEKNEKLSTGKAKLISQKLVSVFLYNIIFGWIHKIVDSLGYEKLVSIADSVNDKTNTVASKLINFSIHSWHKKTLDIDKIKLLHKEFEYDRNNTAMYILKDIVSRHIYMHKIDYQKKQKINALLNFSVQEQISIQSKIGKN